MYRGWCGDRWWEDGSMAKDVELAPMAVRKRLNKRYGSSVRVSRRDYKILWCTRILSDGKEVMGLCSPSDNTISINVNFSPLTEVLLHEIFHAELHEIGLNQRLDYDPNLEEMLVESLAKGLSSAYTLRRRKQ
jgi:hypothetical protein